MSTDPKEVEYYAAQVNAWFNTKFEHDKSLLTLSAGGIGLLVTLLSTVGINSLGALVLCVLALVSFIICLTILLWIFRRNAKHLEDVCQNKATSDPVLALLDKLAMLSFLSGVVFSAIVSISTAINSYQEKEQKLAEDKTNKQVLAYDSVNGHIGMAPTGTAKLSVEGISKMSPENSKPAQANTPSTPPANTSEKK